ncbi:divalent-cation tolerance protein CutA [Streptosporangiaceae bacterium NEAU-GS5]|nr:divalent-cation tolerance protein CutA [Streptosporangiaceae bacterium NEAU-GS5]
MTDPVQVFTAMESEADAVAFARSVVEARLVADAQVIGPVRRFRLWTDDSLEEIHEWQVVMTTTTEALSTLQDHIQADGETVPHLVIIPITSDSGYLNWINLRVDRT